MTVPTAHRRSRAKRIIQPQCSERLLGSADDDDGDDDDDDDEDGTTTMTMTMTTTTTTTDVLATGSSQQERAPLFHRICQRNGFAKR